MSRWTERFAVASAASLVAASAAVLVGAPRRVRVLLWLFGFVCLMVFGMGYLLLPPYLGRTLPDHRPAGAHVVLAVLGLLLLVASAGLDAPPVVAGAGALLWAAGVALFVRSLAATVVAAAGSDDGGARAGLPGGRDSPRVAAATAPVAVGYLAAGTLALLPAAGDFGVSPWTVSLPAVGHAYAAGFAALLVFALGARLLPGFFHASPPPRLQHLTLAAGVVAPALLAGGLWADPWFRVGAVLEAVAMLGYCVGVLVVARRTDRRRVGRRGVVLGALAGLAAVLAGASAAFHVAVSTAIAVHVRLVLAGFFPLTIAGYAFLFFPVTTGRFRGATRRTARAALSLLAVGVALQAAGIVAATPSVERLGAAASLAGALLYSYLLGRRLLEV